MQTKLAVAAACALISASAAADQLKAGELNEFCSSKDLAVLNACRFFVLGVADAIGVASSVGEPKRHVCIPEGVKDSEMVAAYQNMVALDFKAFPRDREMPAVSMLSAVLIKSYPCKASAR